MRSATIVCVALLGCGGRSVEPRPDGWQVDRVVLVTIDGVRWQDIAQGREHVPTLWWLTEQGVGLVEDFRTSAPHPVSLPGYREILTGRRGDRCFDNLCPQIDEPTLFDELAQVVPPSRLGLISSWEGLERASASSEEHLSISTGRHGGATRAQLAAAADSSSLIERAAQRHDFVQHPDFRRDADTMDLALRWFVRARPRFLHVALGDTDEHGHSGNRAAYLAALEAADAFIARLVAAADEQGGETLFLVTADHGRAASFREHGAPGDGSERTWLVAAGGPIPARGFQRPSAPRRLADIAPSLRLILSLPTDRSPRAGAPLPELAPSTSAATAVSPIARR
jgi:hypothetical protein